MRWRLAFLWGVLALVVLTSSGCFLRFWLGRAVVESSGNGFDLISTEFSADSTTATCRRSLITGLLECTYVLTDPDGFLFDITSTSQLVSELGLFGVVVDPLVLELPDGVTNIAGTYAEDGNPANSGALIVYRGLNFVPVDDRRTLTPAPGKQLVIVQLPAGAPVEGVDYAFDLSYQEAVPTGSGPTPFKVLLTGKVEARNGKTFYPPVLPCTSDLEEVPSFTLPVSATPEPIDVPSGVAGCDAEFYTYFFNEGVELGCDLNNDTVVDRDDIDEILGFRNQAVDPGDPRDRDDDGVVTVLDARACALTCTLPRCAVL